MLYAGSLHAHRIIFEQNENSKKYYYEMSSESYVISFKIFPIIIFVHF